LRKSLRTLSSNSHLSSKSLHVSHSSYLEGLPSMRASQRLGGGMWVQSTLVSEGIEKRQSRGMEEGPSGAADHPEEVGHLRQL
jgi:hypothetical protein